MTLLELLLVLAILAVVLGSGAGMFAALDVGRRQAVGLVKSVVRSAQNSAIARQSPARVRIDPEAGTIVAESLQVIGTWHFEGREIEGAFLLDGGHRNCQFVEDGFLGHALSFGSTDGFAEIPVQHDPAYDFREGFAIDVAVRKDGRGGGRFLRFGKTAGIDIGARGEIRGWFLSRIEEEGRAIPGNPVRVETDEGVLPDGRWTRVRLEYDRRRLALFVDGMAVEETPETAPVWRIDEALVLSDPDRPFPGCIDSLVVSAVAADEVAELPETVRFLPDTIREIHFDAGGALDRAFHPDPVFVTVLFEDGAMESVAVGVYGTVE
jgi:hypothetical protein